MNHTADAIDELKATFATAEMPDSAWTTAAEYMAKHSIDPENPLLVSFIDTLRIQSQIGTHIDAALARIEAASAATVAAQASIADESAPTRSQIKGEAEEAASSAIRTAIAEALSENKTGLIKLIVAEYKRQIDPEKRGIAIIAAAGGAIAALILQALVFLGVHHG